MSEAPVTEEFERCIVWGQVTCIPVFTPIDWRENYVVGCGQLCAECAKKQREASEQEILSHTKILRAVELSRKENNKKQTIPSIGDRSSVPSRNCRCQISTRMINNTDHRGNYYRPTKESVIAVCLALGISTEQRWELLNLVFPEEVFYTEAIDNGYSVKRTNEMLEAKGLNALTSG